MAATGAHVFLGHGEQRGPRFVAGSGEANDLRVTKACVQEFDHLYRFDDVVPLTPGAGCRHPDPDDSTIVECPWTEQPTTADVLAVRLGDLADSASIDANNAVISLYGGAGADRFDGRRLTYLYGDAGDDVIRGGTGADELSGGPGRDVVRQ